MAGTPWPAQLEIRFHIDDPGREGPLCVFSICHLILFAVGRGIRGGRVSCDRTGLKFTWAAA